MEISPDSQVEKERIKKTLETCLLTADKAWTSREFQIPSDAEGRRRLRKGLQAVAKGVDEQHRRIIDSWLNIHDAISGLQNALDRNDVYCVSMSNSPRAFQIIPEWLVKIFEG